MTDQRQGALEDMVEDAVEEVLDRTRQDEIKEAKECRTAKSPPWF